MKIIEPKVELLKENDSVSHVARCARICYRKESGNDERLYESLLKRNHLSVFRHVTYYYIIPINYQPNWVNDLFIYINLHRLVIVGINISKDNDYYYVVANGNWCLDHIKLTEELRQFQSTDKEFANASVIAWNMMRYTFKVTTQISTSRELNRVSPNNIAEQSTRYVYEDGTLCRPHWMTKEEADTWNNILDNTFISEVKHFHYINSAKSSFDRYKLLIENSMPRQDARGVLPLDTATICAYTYSAAEWRAIIDLRYYGTTGQPHPNAKIIAGMIREELMNLGYDFR
jgi:thymidylate synthase (FAD)